jgi:NADH-quinone oxidoreductase subunit G
MTRCIHCTRCVRFAQEVAGVPEIGAIGRGEDTEITTYLEASLDSELSGNVIDLCPVGALTSRPYAFTARPWELRKTETIDVMDALGSNIRVDMRGREAMRIMPRNHDDVNEEWLSDKSRFVWDGLNTQRLDRPFIRQDGKLAPASWEDAFSLVAEKLRGKGDKTAAIAGDLVCAEGQFALKGLMDALESPHIDCRQDGAKISGSRGNYIFNAGIAGIEDAEALLLIGSNPRLEAPVLNARIRKRYLMGDFPIAAIGEATELTYKAEFIGAGTDTLADLLAGKQSFAETLKNADKPMILIGQGALTREDGAAVLASAIELAEKTGASFNVLHTAAARVAGLDLGLVPGAGGHDVAAIQDAAQSGAIENVILYGADEIAGASLGDAFVVYIGSHGDRGAHRADVILPAAAYTEKQATYVNTEGRAQMTEQAATPPGEAREDWKIFRALSARLDVTLPYDNLSALRVAMYDAAPHLAQLDTLIAADAPQAPAHDGLGADSFTYAVSDFYFTNPIARASAIMADCAKAKDAPKIQGGSAEGTGTDG